MSDMLVRLVLFVIEEQRKLDGDGYLKRIYNIY